MNSQPPGRRTSGPGKRLATLGLSAILTLGLLEIGWRVYLNHLAPWSKQTRYSRWSDLPEHAFKYRPHPYLSYALNESYVNPERSNRHNSLGFRGADLTLKKPAGTFRIACLGGSTTYTNRVQDWTQSYPAQLERILREEYGLSQVEVINAGVGGYSSWESAINLQLRVLPIDPDLVIVYHGTNDVHPRFVAPEAYRRDNEGYRQSWQARDPWWDRSRLVRYLGVQWGFSQGNGLSSLVRVHKRLVPEPELADQRLEENQPIFFIDNLRNMHALCSDRGIPMVLATWAHSAQMDDYAATEHYQRGFGQSNQAVRELSAERSIPLYDFAREMPDDPQYWSDGRHVNELGAHLKAELFASWLAASQLIIPTWPIRD